MNEQFDIAVIGAGPGGYSTALRASQLGLNVALIERDATPGGTCLNRGCIPTKTLLDITATFDAIRHTADAGINAHIDSIDFNAVHERRTQVVSTMVHGLSALLAQRGVTVFQAEASLDRGTSADPQWHTVRLAASPNTADVLRRDAKNSTPQGPELTIEARHVVLATGSRPRPLPGTPFHNAIIDSTQALTIDFPKSAVIIGAGAVAVEFASIWNSAGCDVTLIIRKDRVLSAWDRRVGVTLTRELARNGITIIKNASITHVESDSPTEATVRYRVKGSDEETTLHADTVLGAIGRDANTNATWLSDAGVERDEQGLIVTDAYGRTHARDIWAVGDIVAGHALAHRAFEQGITVAERIAGLDVEPVDEDTVPQVVFSRPQAACVGLTGAQAKADERFLNVAETAYPMMGNARMLMSGTTGALSVVSGELAAKPGVRVVLGVHMVSPEATELIAEAEQLVGNRVPLSEAARLIHPHPTFSEAFGEALLKADGRPLHTR